MVPRVTAEFWVKALIRRCAVANVPAMVVRRGFETAGTVLIKINRLGPGCTVLVPIHDVDGNRLWRRATGPDPVEEATADAYIEREIGRDPDLWVLEIEDREGRHFTEEPVEG